MSLLILEALLALAVLLFIVWWTMFHGRARGELDREPENGRTEALENALPNDSNDSNDREAPKRRP